MRRSSDLLKLRFSRCDAGIEPPFDDVLPISSARIGEIDGPFVGVAPASRLTKSGLPWALQETAVTWGRGFPTCVMPRPNQKPDNQKVLGHPSLDGSDITLTRISRKQVDVQMPDGETVSIRRSGVLGVQIVAPGDRTLIKESYFYERLARDWTEAEASLSIALSAAEHFRRVWSIWRHLANGI